MKLKFKLFLFKWILIFGCSLVFGQYNNPQMMDGRPVMVHLFEWKFSDIKNECEFLSASGFGGIQVSPVHESVVTPKRAWWERYQPVSYKMTSRSGTEEEFAEMVRACNDNKIRIYVDVVINHMAAGDGEVVGTSGSKASTSALIYPAVPYSPTDFNENCNIENYTDALQVRNCRLVSLPDLNQAREEVQSKIAGFMDKLIDYGVAGFRVDACKHMWPEDLRSIFTKLKDLNTEFGFEAGSRPYIFCEVIDYGTEAISKTEYNGLGAVTEFLHSREISLTFRGKKPFAKLLHWGPGHGFLSTEDALVFVCNHDNQREAPDLFLTYRDPKEYKMAMMFMLAHPYGTPRIMSSYSFANFDQGPPTDEYENILSPELNEMDQCMNGWICEHRWPEIVGMVGFRNIVKDSPVGNWADNGQNQMAFCRGNSGFIAFNGELSLNFVANLIVCVPPGVYCDVISGGKKSGNCVGKSITVNEESKAQIEIPFTDEIPVLAIHLDTKL